MSDSGRRWVIYFYGYDPRAGRYYEHHFRRRLPSWMGRHDLEGPVVESEDEDGAVLGIPAAGVQLSIFDWTETIWETLIRSVPALIMRTYVLGLRWLVGRSALNWMLSIWKCFCVYFVLLALPLAAVVGHLATLILWLAGYGGWPLLAVSLGCAAAAAAQWLAILRGQYARFLIWAFVYCLESAWSMARSRDALDRCRRRVDRLAVRVATALRDEPGLEVVIVGHSLGAPLAIRAAAQLSKEAGLGDELGRVRLVTLGGSWSQVVLCTGPGAEATRRDMRQALDGVEWLDVSAWEDVLSMPQTRRIVDRLCAGSPAAAARFDWAEPELAGNLRGLASLRARWNFARMHFQYIEDEPGHGGYDFSNILFRPWGRTPRDMVWGPQG